jgi:hypothetical protein
MGSMRLRMKNKAMKMASIKYHFLKIEAITRFVLGCKGSKSTEKMEKKQFNFV